MTLQAYRAKLDQFMFRLISAKRDRSAHGWQDRLLIVMSSDMTLFSAPFMPLSSRASRPDLGSRRRATLVHDSSYTRHSFNKVDL